MDLSVTLRGLHAGLGQVSVAYRAVDEHSLAKLARSRELADGMILAPRATTMSSYLPYHAARPVAAHTGGLRRAGFAASAAWGASLGVSSMRTDLPLLSLYWLAYHKDHRPQFAPTPAPATTDGKEKSPAAHAADLARLVVQAAPYASFLLAGWEAVFGTGYLPDDANLAAHDPRVLAERWRRVGAAGCLEAYLMQTAQHAGRQGQDRRELALLGAAVGLRLALMPPRLLGALFVGSVALVGAAFGVAYEAAAQGIYRGYLADARARGVALEERTMRDAIARQYMPRNNQLRELDDTVLSAPLMEALWRQAPDQALHENNRWVGAGVALATLHRHQKLRNLGFLPQVFEMQREERAWRALGRAISFGWVAAADGAAGGAPAAGVAPDPDEARRFARGVDVHERGRDPAMRRSLDSLLARYPAVDNAAALAALRAELNRQQRLGTPLARRQHASGRTLLAAANLALDPTLGAPAGFPAVLDSSVNHVVRLDDGRRVPLSSVCALVWHACEQLEDPRGTPALHEAMRQERKEALLSALGDCITSYGTRVCGPGQAQRMLMVLQGCVEGVQIEDIEEAPTPAQVETFLYQQIQADLPDEPTNAQVQARYDLAYREGTARLPAAQHAQLRAGLAALAEMDHNYAWRPNA